jgi:hypothetical protein
MGRRGACLLVLVLAAASCSQGGGDLRAADLLPPSTTGRVAASIDRSGPPPPTPAQIRREFDKAIADQDMCAVVVALDSQVPDVGDPSAVTETYRILADATRRSKAFAPAAIADSWNGVIDATARAAVEAERAGGDINDPSIGAQFSTSEFDEAYRQVIAWSVVTCP